MVDELLDIVNEHDEVIGQLYKAEVYAQNMCNFRVVNAFIQNDHGLLWIPRRTKNKRIFPLCLDTSMGGHVSAGESYQDALKRELMEELCIDISTTECREIGSLNPYQHGVSAFMKVFLIQSNETPSYNTQDFVESFWITPQELLTALQQGEKSKDDLPKIVRHLFI